VAFFERYLSPTLLQHQLTLNSPPRCSQVLSETDDWGWNMGNIVHTMTNRRYMEPCVVGGARGWGCVCTGATASTPALSDSLCVDRWQPNLSAWQRDSQHSHLLPSKSFWLL
jgi:hypothetical protein